MYHHSFLLLESAFLSFKELALLHQADIKSVGFVKKKKSVGFVVWQPQGQFLGLPLTSGMTLGYLLNLIKPWFPPP